jgi:hypothetical protein
VAAHLDISIGSAYAIMHDDLGYRKVCARWVPKELTVEHKRQREEVATQFIRQHTWLRQQPKSFFSTGIQKLVERYNKCIVLQGDYVDK